MQNWGCRGLMCKTPANGISQVSLPIACKSFFLVFMPGKSFPLRHSRTVVHSSGAPIPTSGTSILHSSLLSLQRGRTKLQKGFVVFFT